MRKLYISAIPLLLLVSCAKDMDQQILSETGEKTPLTMNISIKDGYNQLQTKALDGTFEKNDVLQAYVQQVSKSGDTYTAKISKLISFTVGTAGSTVTSDNLGTVLYWDDFSNTDDDIRGTDRYLRVGYGFCFNGGTPTTGLTGDNVAAGKIQGWTIQNDQTTDNSANVRKSDLLWAGPQTAVQYNHDSRPTLPAIYTHAMSKLTVELRLGDGYEVDNNGKALAFGTNSTTPTIFVNTSCAEVDAVNQTISTNVSSGDDAKVQMYLSDNEATTNKVRVYEAIIAPTVMKAGNKIAEVTVDGNKYEITLTHAIMNTGYESGAAWTTKLNAYSTADSKVTKTSGDYTETDGGITLPGVNYKLVVNLKKQKIDVSATITNWLEVTAGGEGVINFGANVITSNVTDGSTAITSEGAAFDLWRSEDGVSYGDKATTATYGSSVWTTSPNIYWKDGTTSYYFRGLSRCTVVDAVAGTYSYSSVDGSLAANQGTDLLWAQTSKHTGTEADNTTTHNYEAGAAINPRTSAVPMTFEHAMSRITVKLESSGSDPVDVDGAKISVVGIYDCSLISLADGSIYNRTASSDIPIANQTSIVNCPVVPQSLLQMADGTVRTGEVTFYDPNDLTTIYSDGTSIGTGDGTSYVTSTLASVYYTEDEAKTYNAALDGAVKKDDVKEAARTYTLAEYNSLSPLPHASITEDQFNALADEAKIKTAAEYYTYEDFKALTTLTAEQFAALPDDLKDGATTVEAYNNLTVKPHTKMTETQFNTLFNALSEAAKTKTAAVYYTLDEFKALTELTEVQLNALPDSMKTRAQVLYTQEEADAYNAALPGAKSTSDLHHYKLKKNDKEEVVSTKANVGDIKSIGANPKVVLHIVLKDNTSYAIDLATCTDGSNAITTWSRGTSYTYTITLSKEQITFRALVKDWVETAGSGNANLDWD